MPIEVAVLGVRERNYFEAMKLLLIGSKELLLTGLGEASWCLLSPQIITRAPLSKLWGAFYLWDSCIILGERGERENIVSWRKIIMVRSWVVVSPNGTIEFSHRLPFRCSLPLFTELFSQKKNLNDSVSTVMFSICY